MERENNNDTQGGYSKKTQINYIFINIFILNFISCFHCLVYNQNSCNK